MGRPEDAPEAPAPGAGWLKDPKEVKRQGFAPAPRIPAPLRGARPPKRFRATAATVIGEPPKTRPAKPVERPVEKSSGKAGRKAKKERPAKGIGRRRRKEKDDVPVAEEEGLATADEDRTPTWFYKLVLVLSVVGAFVSFLYYNSQSDVIGPGWRLAFLVLLGLYAVVGIAVWVRLARKLDYGTRFVAWLGRRRDNTILFFRNAATGAVRSVTQAGRGFKEGGSQFREGFQSGREPNFVVKMIQKVIRGVIKLIVGIIRLIVWVFLLVYRIYVLAVRILWAVYRGIAEPVLLLAFRIVRWALKVVWRVGRWALKVVWRIFYWLVRRWPIKYVTRMLEEPVEDWARRRVLLVNIVVSDALGAPVKPEIRQKEAPYLEMYQLHHETRVAARLIDKEERINEERDLWLTIPTAEERKALAQERKRRKADEKAAAAQAKIDAKEAKKQAKKREKEEIKQAKAEGRDLKAERKEAKKKAKAEKGGKGEEDAAGEEGEAAAGKKGKKPKLSAKEKKELKRQAKLEKEQAKKDAKAEKKLAKKEAKAEKKGKGKDETSAAESADAGQ